MSILTTQTLQFAPAAATPITLPSSVNIATNSAWVEFLSVAPSRLAIVGFIFAGTFASTEVEFDIGVGTAGSEVAVTTLRCFMFNSGGSGSVDIYYLPAPVDLIASGARVSVRTRHGSSLMSAALAYYVSPTMDNVSGGVATTCAPSRAVGVSVAGSGIIWANSAWVQMTPGINHSIAVIGVEGPINPTGGPFVGSEHWEIDLGIGAPGSEVVLSTFCGRSGGGGSGGGDVPTLSLPAVARLSPNTPVSFRWRSDTASNVNPWTLALLYYDSWGNTSLPVPTITPAATPAGCTPQSTISNGGKGHYGCNNGGFGLVSAFPPGSGDGVAAVHPDPVSGELLTGKTGIDIWVEVDVTAYPSGTLTTYRRSLVDLGDT